MKPSTHRVTSSTDADLQYIQQGRQPLWRQVQVKHRRNIVQLNLQRNQSQNIDIGTKFQNCLLSPVQIKVKQKRPTISNFLKTMQVQIDQNQSKYQCDQDASQIVSVNDIKYIQQFDSLSRCKGRGGLRKSFVADTKFQMFLLLTGFKESYNALKETVTGFSVSYVEQLQNVNNNIKKLVLKYQSELTTKTHELKQLQLTLREYKIQTIQQKYQLEHKIIQLQGRNTKLEQQSKQISKKYEQQQQNNRKIQGFNIQSNQVILNLHRKIQQLQQKQKIYMANYQVQVSNQLQKLKKQYQNLSQELRQSYQIKLKNVKIKMEKQLRNSTNSIPNFSNIQQSKQDQTVSNANTMAMSQFSNMGGLQSGGGLELRQFYQGRQYQQKIVTQNNRAHNNHHQIKQQSVSSPKSIGSNKRFARTSKPDINNTNMNGTPLKKPAITTPKQSSSSAQLRYSFTQRPQNCASSSLLTKTVSPSTFSKFSLSQNNKFLPPQNSEPGLHIQARNTSVGTFNNNNNNNLMNSPKHQINNNEFFSSSMQNPLSNSNNKNNNNKNKDNNNIRNMAELKKMIPLQTISSQISQILDDDDSEQQVQIKNNNVQKQKQKNMKYKQDINNNFLINTVNTTSTANTRNINNNNNNNNNNVINFNNNTKLKKNLVIVDKLRETIN